jgi:predicted nucleic acid-binding protein
MKIDAILLDTNILLRAAARDEAEHSIVSAALDSLISQNTKLFTCSQNLYEMWVVLTRPREANGYGLSTSETARLLREVIRSFPDTFGVSRSYREGGLRLSLRYDVKGKQVHDARLVALMKSENIYYILTLNKSDFVRFQPEIMPIHPSEITPQE